MKITKTFFLALTLGVAVLFTNLPALQASEPTDPQKPLLLTSIPAMQSLAEILTAGTNINVKQVIPSNYALNGHHSYLKKHQDRFFTDAAKADAVLTVMSAWPKDPLYTWARRSNIRIVNIDTTRPLNGRGAGVPIIETVSEQNRQYVWRSPANFMRMAAITADDISALYPDEKTQITKNLQRLQAKIFVLRSAYEQKFVTTFPAPFAMLSDAHMYLIDEFGLFPEFSFLKPEHKWTAQDRNELKNKLREFDVKTVVCQWLPQAETIKMLESCGANAVVMKTYKGHATKDEPLEDIIRWYGMNLGQIN